MKSYVQILPELLNFSPEIVSLWLTLDCWNTSGYGLNIVH